MDFCLISILTIYLFLTENTDVCNYAKDLQNLISRLENDSVLAIEWFECNYMKLNHDKYDLLISGHEYESVWAYIGSCKIWESKDQKLLRVNIDRNLKLNHYILKQCKKAGRKLSALTKICKFMKLRCRRVLIKSFIESQYTCCPLVWMYYDNRTNHLHKRAPRTVYNGNV